MSGIVREALSEWAERHQGRAQWIRTACVAFLTGPDASHNADLIDDIEVVDQRAREVVRDLIRRVEALESDRPSGATSSADFARLRRRPGIAPPIPHW